MIPRAFRILYPSAPVVDTPSTVERQDTGGSVPASPPVSEHARLTDRRPWIVEHHDGRRIVCTSPIELMIALSDGTVRGVWQG